MRTAIAAICLCLASAVCQAENIYRWTGSDGRTYYGDLPPSGAANITRVNARAAASEAAPASPVTPARDELAVREDDCARKRQQVESYRSAALLVEKDSLGREREFSEEERQLLIARTEAEINVLCGGP